MDLVHVSVITCVSRAGVVFKETEFHAVWCTDVRAQQHFGENEIKQIIDTILRHLGSTVGYLQERYHKMTPAIRNLRVNSNI